ncbi:uncharacterized protein OCT59_009638 [Rhizophagus irregularis]|uniref:uncharacterized protein n=1 Tax=Rhizophagus irregularis TaxID=588596 RepID=UPI003334264D|nr:hypothetical protein OCT59_009638 [Rhizophagus irregularis]
MSLNSQFQKENINTKTFLLIFIYQKNLAWLYVKLINVLIGTVSDWEEREMIRRHINYKRSTLSDKTQKTLKSRKPNGNSKRFKRKVVESNDEINEEEQQTSGSTLSTKNCGNF